LVGLMLVAAAPWPSLASILPENPARPLRPALSLALRTWATAADHTPLQPDPGYDQRTRSATGARIMALPEAAAATRHGRWTIGVTLGSELIADSAWDLMALPPGYNDELSDPGVDWRARIWAARLNAWLGTDLGERVRIGATLFTERWSSDIEHTLSTSSGLAPPLSRLYTHLSSSGAGLTGGGSVGLWLDLHPRLELGATLRSQASGRWTRDASARSDVPAALQWTEGLPAEVVETGRYEIRRRSPAQIWIEARHRPVLQGGIRVALGWCDRAKLSGGTPDPWIEGISDEHPAPDPTWRTTWSSAWRGAGSIDWDWGPAAAWIGLELDGAALEEASPLFAQQAIAATWGIGASWRAGDRMRIAAALRWTGEQVREGYAELSGHDSLRRRGLTLTWIWTP